MTIPTLKIWRGDITDLLFGLDFENLGTIINEYEFSVNQNLSAEGPEPPDGLSAIFGGIRSKMRFKLIRLRQKLEGVEFHIA